MAENLHIAKVFLAIADELQEVANQIEHTVRTKPVDRRVMDVPIAMLSLKHRMNAGAKMYRAAANRLQAEADEHETAQVLRLLTGE